MIDYFNDKNNKSMHKYAQFQVGKTVSQNKKNGMSHLKKIMAIPQTKNENSYFNFMIYLALVNSEKLLINEG